MYNVYVFLFINIQCDEEREDATSHDVSKVQITYGYNLLNKRKAFGSC